MPKVEDDKMAKQYLLGELSEQELAKFEAEYFANDEAFERLGAVEDDLIDAYILGQLSTNEREHFEQRLLLSSAQRERVKFARTLLHTLSVSGEIASNLPPPTRKDSWWFSPITFLKTHSPAILIPVAVMLILAAFAGWWLIQSGKVKQTQELQARQTSTPAPAPENQTPDAITRQASQLPIPTDQTERRGPKQQPTPDKQLSRIVTFALIEGSTRDPGDSTSLDIPVVADAVRLDLMIESNEYKSYRAELRTAVGILVWRQRDIGVKTTTAGKASLVLQLPAGILKNGDYILTLRRATKRGGFEVAAEYSFRVARK